MPRAIYPLLLAVLLDLLGFGIVIPLLTFYVEEHGASPLQVTLLMAVYSLMQFVCAPLWGALSDRRGRRPVMLFSIAMTALCLFGFATAASLPLLFLFRALHGAATANISTAQAAVADLTTPENRARGMGLIGAAFGVGFTLGPWVGGELARFGYEVPILVAAGLSVLNLAVAAALLPETRVPGAVGAPHAVRTLDPRQLWAALAHPVVGLCVALTFAMTLAFAMMESTFTLFAEHVRQLDAPTVGRFFGVSGLVMVLVQGGLIRHLVRRTGEASLVPAGVGLLAVAMALLPLAPPPLAMVLVFCLMAVGQGIASPSLNAMISRGAGAHEQGLVLGANQSMSALARAVGPTIAGLAYTHGGPSSPFFGAAGLLACALPLAVVAAGRWRRLVDQPG
jgi:MFS transporter, DHA1 family, tetracycline resistance protein